MAGEAARFFARCAAVLRTRSTDRKLAEELESHFRTLEEEYRGKGMSPGEAYRTARLRLGGVQQLLEDHRDVRGFAWVDAMIRDAYIGVRSMKRTPGFTVVVLLTLAIGIGGTTAMFSMINTVLLRQLPYGEADRLVSVTRGGPGEPLGRYISADRLNIIKASARTFADIGAHFAGTEDALLVKGDTSEVVKAARVSANFLDILRVQPELGRPFLREDDIVGSAPTAMISDRLWRRRFGADAAILTTPVTLSSRSVAIVGVLPPDFRFPFPAVDIWFPQPEQMTTLVAPFRLCCAPLMAFGRLSPNYQLQDAQRELEVLNARYAADRPGAVDAGPVHAAPLKNDMTAGVSTMLWLLLAAVGCVLCIGSANVAVLFMARATARARELAVRAALGASQGQLLRQLAIESVVLSVCGGLAGLMLAKVILSLVRGMTVFELPRAVELTLDPVAIAVTFVLSVATGVVFGTLPSLQMVRSRVPERLRDGRSVGTVGPSTIGGLNARAVLVIGQIAMSVVLVIGAGLMFKTLAHLAAVDPGFQPDGLLTMRVPLPATQYDTPEKRVAFFAEIVRRVQGLPGVRSVAVSRSLPTTPGVLGTNVQIEEHPVAPPGHLGIRLQTVTPDYFKVLGVALKRGRALTGADDRIGAAPVVMVNESFARRFWPGYPRVDPLGKRIEIPILKPSLLEIVGVTGDVRDAGLTTTPEPHVYVPEALYPPQSAYLSIRSEGAPTLLVRPVISAIHAIDGNQSATDARMMNDVLEASVGQRHLATRLLAAFAATALLLAVVGLYGALAYSVSQRTSEIGVRRALGASTREVVTLVLRQMLILAAVGVTVGLGLALGLTRALQSLLFQVDPTDPIVFVTTGGLFLLVAALAACVPVWRAIRISPLVALRA